MIYEIKYTTKFKKDIKLIQRQGKNLDKLFAVIELLADARELDIKYKDHELSGNYAGFRECHIEPDWLLIYQYEDNKLNLLLVATGSHSNLFNK